MKDKLNYVNRDKLCLSVLQSMMNARDEKVINIEDAIDRLTMVGLEWENSDIVASEYVKKKHYLWKVIKQARRDKLTTMRISGEEIVLDDDLGQSITEFVVKNYKSDTFCVTRGTPGKYLVSKLDGPGPFEVEFRYLDVAITAALEERISTETRKIKLDCVVDSSNYKDDNLLKEFAKPIWSDLSLKDKILAYVESEINLPAAQIDRLFCDAWGVFWADTPREELQSLLRDFVTGVKTELIANKFGLNDEEDVAEDSSSNDETLKEIEAYDLSSSELVKLRDNVNKEIAKLDKRAELLEKKLKLKQMLKR